MGGAGEGRMVQSICREEHFWKTRTWVFILEGGSSGAQEEVKPVSSGRRKATEVDVK